MEDLCQHTYEAEMAHAKDGRQRKIKCLIERERERERERGEEE